MKKPNLLLMLFGEIRRRLISSFQVLGFLLFGTKEKVSSIDIYGDRAFCEAVKQALLLLKEKDPATFDIANDCFTLIIQSQETLLSPFLKGAALAIEGKEAVDTTPTWLACL